MVGCLRSEGRCLDTVGRCAPCEHFQAVVHQDKLYALAGRTTSQRTNQGFDLTVASVDVYDFETNRWMPPEACPDIPAGRAGNMAMAWGGAIIVGGGESGAQKVAHNEVEALDVVSKIWRTWPRLHRGRHGSGFAIIGDYAYTASGSGDRGGGPELTSIEKLKLSTIRNDNQSGVQQWHTKTLSFRGPKTSESATPNPFTDYRLQVTFTHPVQNT